MQSVSITTLGGFELRIGGVRAEPGGRKLAALLCVLALDGTVGRERLAELLWPGAEPEAARLSVRQALWRLRQVVGDVLISSRYAAQLDLSRVEVDAPQFLARARHAPPLETLRRYGPFLDGLVLEGEALEAWADAHRETYHRRALRALTELLRTLPPGEALDEATGFWERLAPTDGPLTRILLRGLTARGEMQAATRVLDHHRAALHAALDAAPDPETERLLTPQRADPAGLAFAFSLPAPATPLLGRDEELHLLGELWLGGARLVTLLGPGGIGKTHLALHYALHYARRAAGSPGLRDLGGVAAVRLDTLGTPGGLLAHVAAALRFAAPAHLLAALRHTPTLLVLDNFEPLLRSGAGAARAAVGELLAAAPDLRVLITSRERLNVAGEGVLALDGLDTRGPEGGPATELLRRAAQRAAPRRVPGPAEARQLAELTQGHPLLLELTAAALASLEPGEVLRGLRTSLLELRGGPADWPARHLASASVLDSSFARLDPAALRGLRQLAVVAGDYAPADARALAGQLGAWQQLQDLGLLIQQGEGLRLHELVRQRALNGADLDALRERHAAHYAARAGHLRADLRGERQLAALQELRQGEHHFRAAAEHAARQGPDPRLAPLLDALGLFLWMAGRLPELLALTSALAAVPGGEQPTARSWHGLALAMNGEAEQGLALLEEAAPHLDTDAAQGGLGALLGLERLAFAQLQLRRTPSALATYETLEARARGHFPALHGRALLGQSAALKTVTNDESPTATALVAQGAAVLAGSGDLHGLAQALSQQSSDELNMGEVSDQTAPRVGRTLALREALGDARGLVVSTLHLAGVATARGDGDEALRTARQALERARQGGDEVLIADVHYVLARTLQRAGDLPQAHLEMRTAGELYRQNGSHREASTYLERADFSLMQRDWATSAALARRAAEVAWAAGQTGMALFGLAICAQALAGGRPDDPLLPELVHTVLTHPGTFRNARDRLTPLERPTRTSAALPVGELLRRLALPGR